MEQQQPDRRTRLRSGFKNSNLAQAWLVLLLALVFGSALAAVQVNLGHVIEANKVNETLEKIPELVFGADAARKLKQRQVPIEITPGTIAVEKDGRKAYYKLFRVTRDGTPAGWVIKARGQGYADVIELLIGLDDRAQTITGIFVLEQKETPGLGNNIGTARWRSQFVNKSTDRPLVVVKGGAKRPDAIDAVTGATISSRSVTRIVNRTIEDLRGRLIPAKIEFSERHG
jgi:electron transport complex protein RnfG